MNGQASDAANALQIRPERPEMVMAALRDNLLGMSSQMPSPALAGPLAFFGRLAGWSASAVSVGSRAVEHSAAVEDVRTAAAGLGIVEPSVCDLIDALVTDDRAEASALVTRLLAALREAELGIVQCATAATSDRQVGVAEVSDYLSMRFADGSHATDVTVIPGGYSKTTLLVAANIAGAEQEIVLRLVPASQPAESLAPEFAVLTAVWTPDMLVPEPLWIENNPSALGGAFFASRRAPGAPLGTVSGADGAELPASVITDIAAFLARLHAIDPSAVVSTPVLNMRDQQEVHAAIDDLVSRHLEHVGPVPPRLRAVIGWLHAHVVSPATVSIVHGDPGFQNTLAAEGRMTAVLDWERAHLGDAAEDLAYVKPCISQVYDWETFLASYSEAGGQVPDEATMSFYTVWQDAWRHVECARIGQSFYASGKFSSAVAGFVLGPEFLDSAVNGAFGTGSA